MKTIRPFLMIYFLVLLSLVVNGQSELTAPAAIKNRVIKLDFFSPVTGNLTFGYEQVLTNNITLEGNLGFIGIGFVDDVNNPAGMFLKGGPRLYFSPDYFLEGMKRYNDFQGAYFKPEFIYSGFGFDYDVHNSMGSYKTLRGVNNSIALMLNVGKQWVLAKVVSIDLHAGIGYGTSFYSYKDIPPGYMGYDSYYPGYKYSHIEAPEVPLTFSAGFDIGILLK